MAARTPQDRKTTDAAYRFTHAGKTYTLPSTEAAAGKVPAGITMDAILEPDSEMTQARLGIAMLVACGASDEAMAAVRAMPTSDMITIIGEWMSFTPPGGASLGESSGSSA
jgi:hypothetical protein